MSAKKVTVEGKGGKMRPIYFGRTTARAFNEMSRAPGCQYGSWRCQSCGVMVIGRSRGQPCGYCGEILVGAVQQKETSKPTSNSRASTHGKGITH